MKYKDLEKEDLVIISKYFKTLKAKYSYIDPVYKNFFYEDFISFAYKWSKLCTPEYIKVGVKKDGKLQYGIINNYFDQKYPLSGSQIEDSWFEPIIPCQFDEINLLETALTEDMFEKVWNKLKFVKAGESVIIQNYRGRDAILNFSRNLENNSTYNEVKSQIERRDNEKTL